MGNDCNCDPGFYRCQVADRLWRQAENIYYSDGYDTWINSPALKKYKQHMKAVYDREHIKLREGTR